MIPQYYTEYPVLLITQRNWQHFKMATSRAGKVARKNNGRFQSTKVKKRKENFFDSRKRESSDSLMLKCHFSLSAKVRPYYRAGVLSGLVCFPRSLLMVVFIATLSFFDICEYLECPTHV